LSEAEPHPRGRPTLERGGTSPEEATDPRARRRFGSAVPRPLNEAEFRPRVAGPTVLVGRWGHQRRGPCRCFIPATYYGEYPNEMIVTRRDR
jgi:hypothetical protein